MSLDKNNIVILGKQVLKANKKAPIAFKFNDKEYTYESLNSTLRDEFNALASSYNAYRRNKNDIFEIMQEVIDEVLPKKVLMENGQK
jgi:hypothetical protein